MRRRMRSCGDPLTQQGYYGAMCWLNLTAASCNPLTVRSKGFWSSTSMSSWTGAWHHLTEPGKQAHHPTEKHKCFCSSSNDSNPTQIKRACESIMLSSICICARIPVDRNMPWASFQHFQRAVYHLCTAYVSHIIAESDPSNPQPKGWARCWWQSLHVLLAKFFRDPMCFRTPLGG